MQEQYDEQPELITPEAVEVFEKYGVFNYMKGITTIPRFFQHYAAMANGHA